ncbi:cytochrome c [Marivita sp. GX14005]|uniref:c-type cytochrome n=1 Tax=Marivita sp. GX14005 TaxID=2942276 RepID=UPI002018D53D|nr:cytochrome c [Marivita sp. GX14005]
MNRPLVLSLVAALATGAGAAETPRDAEALKHFVHQDCGSCHGLSLKGGLGPDIRAKALEHYDPEVLREVILGGIPGTAMPPWRPLLTDPEIDWIVDYLMTGEE